MAIWKQPVLTANGTWGNDTFAVRSGGGADSNTYAAFDSNLTSWVNKWNVNAYIEWNSSTAIEVSEISIYSSDGYLPAKGKLQYSDDGSTFIDCGTWIDTSSSTNASLIITESIGYHKYYRLTSLARSTAHPSNNADITNIVISATYDSNNSNKETITPILLSSYTNNKSKETITPIQLVSYTNRRDREDITPVIMMSYIDPPIYVRQIYIAFDKVKVPIYPTGGAK